MKPSSLLKAALNAGIWTLAGHGFSQALRLLGNLALARLLAPEFFGVMAVATVVMVGVFMFSDLGLRQVIVRSPRASDPDFVNTVWTLQVLQGAAAAALLLCIAGVLAYARHVRLLPADSTYGSKDLPLLVMGLSAGAILAGMESTKLATAEKDMLLRPVVLVEVGSQAIGLLAMCAWALVQPSVFVLLVGAVVSGTVKVAASHLLPRGVPNRLHLSWPVVRQVCGISNWIVVSSALAFLAANVDKLLLAWLLDPRAMGQFAIAALLVGALTDLVGRVSSRVAYPAITKAHERDGGGLPRTGLAHSYYRARLPTDAFCLLLAAFLFWHGQEVVRLLYDDRYAQAGEFLRILAITLVGARYAVVSYMYLLLGETRLMAAEQAFRLAGLLLAIGLGYRLAGPTGAAWGVALGQLAGSAAGMLLFQPRLGLLSVRRELWSLALFASAFGLFGLTRH